MNASKEDFVDLNWWAPTYDSHVERHHDVTVPQLTLFVIWITSLLVWIVSRKFWCRRDEPVRLLPEKNVLNMPTTGQKVSSDGTDKLKDSTEPLVAILSQSAPCAEVRLEKVEASSHPRGSVEGRTSSAPDLDQCMKQIAVTGAILLYFYLCDYVKIFPAGERFYNRDTFLFLVFILLLIGCLFTIQQTDDKVLNRNQTEEWKGWMQVMFVWYHYFAAKEWYNWIRVYIACYVWMTGFGNFSFFWVRQDYSVLRVAKMLFRLDFLVLLICASVSNAYMVYYICAMHTYWFLSVYVTMALFPSWNRCRYRMITKLVLYATFNAVLFDIFPSTVGRFVFQPLSFILGLKQEGGNSLWSDPLYEWQFRVGLDHWACFIGMLCAYNYQHIEFFLRGFDSPRLGTNGRDAIKWIVVTTLTFSLAVWYWIVGSIANKADYNRIHPYTSWIPIVVYIVARNLSATLRTYYIGLFAWLGRVTLETYLAQLHIYLQSNAKQRIVYLKGTSGTEYPLLNFSLATLVYVAVSFKLFNITNVISAYFLPLNDNVRLVKRSSIAVVYVVSAALLASLIKTHS